MLFSQATIYKCFNWYKPKLAVNNSSNYPVGKHISILKRTCLKHFLKKVSKPLVSQSLLIQNNNKKHQYWGLQSRVTEKPHRKCGQHQEYPFLRLTERQGIRQFPCMHVSVVVVFKSLPRYVTIKGQHIYLSLLGHLLFFTFSFLKIIFHN